MESSGYARLCFWFGASICKEGPSALQDKMARRPDSHPPNLIESRPARHSSS